jgi:tRNA (guanine-N7-)-methyltransferase
MPNIQTPKLEYKPFPFTKDGYTFHYKADDRYKDESLIYTTFEDKAFFIVVIKRESDFLIKHDKLTRISPIYIIKNGIKAFRDALNLETTFSNIDGDNKLNHISKSDDYLKKITYFVDEFKITKEIWVEVGFGSGRHLLYQAKKNPDIQFIGLEIHGPSIEQVVKQCKIQEIENILIVNFDARIFLEFLDSNSVGKIFVHFPVPWDKKPHRRVISTAFINESIRVLKEGGKLELRTDSENYYAYSYERFISQSSVDLNIRKNQDIEISSKYEDRWKKMEKNIYDITLTNHIVSPPKDKRVKMSFEKSVNFAEVKKRFHTKTMRESDNFVHFEALYEVDESCGVIKLSFGAYEKCEHKYLIFNDNKIQYFPYEALPIEQNLKSHKKIEEFLYE